MAAHEVESDESLRLSVEVRSGQKARGGVQVLHLLQFVVERLGLERIEAEVKRPLSGMRLAAYYGCLLTRPSNVLGFDDPEQPTSMDRLLRVLGADSVTWSHKAECCGAGFSASEPGIVLELGSQVLVSAQDGGAQAVVVACPLCQSNLDIRQHEMERRMGVSLNLPVIYFTQLIGLAFGFSPRSLGLGRLVVDPRPALKAWGFR
jgi:heterodisulfide reductase subunit B